MKKTFLITLIASSFAIFAQNTKQDISKANEIIWYGLNFSQAKMVGQFDQAVGAGAATASELKNEWVPAWNTLIISEPQNFKIKESLKKDKIYFDIKPTEKMNRDIKTDDFMGVNAFTFADASGTLQNIVSQLSGGDKNEGIGMVFIVESFNKTNDEASVYVTLFDIKTKSVLVTERIVGKPKGIGLRNFWAGAIKHIIKQIDDRYYDSWK
ncbi:MAG: hypothetical protein K0S53_1269 [Bacteroidetes bacterium]|jgi:hypothetical protein|nr:hypothetical protein [Bacteroidota bacterium]